MNNSKKEKLTLIELFSGMGAQAKAFERLDCFETEVVATSDLDKEVVCNYAAIHCGLTNEMINSYSYPSKEEMIKELSNKNLGYDFEKDKPYNWEKLAKKKDKTKGIEKYWLADKLSKNFGDITKIKSLPETNMLFYSAPCFVEGTLVLTDNGYKPIEEINVGDLVLTHTNSYRKVIKTMVNDTNTLIKLDAMPSESLYCTPKHPFYVRKRYRKWNNSKRKYDRKFEDPTWVEAKDLTKDHFVGIAINQESKLPDWNGIDIQWCDRDRTEHKNILSKKFESNDFWYLIGRFIGDGWVRSGYGIIVCGNSNKMLSLSKAVDNLGFNYSIVHEKTNDKMHIHIKELGEYCSQFGRGAANKHLTSDIFNLPIDKLKSFIGGYLDSDGSFTQDMYKITSVSRTLIYDVSQCIAKAYNVPFSIYYAKRKSQTIIEGRIVNQKNQHTITFKTNPKGYPMGFFENGYIWVPIRNVSVIQKSVPVYNMEVENDNSYVVQGMIVHNCTDWSVAGKLAGGNWTCLDCGNQYNPMQFSVEDRYTCPCCGSHNIKSTRSGLLFEVERLLVDYQSRNILPEYLVLENVANLVSKKFIDSFNDWVQRLDNFGYNTYWTLINAKDCGVPQSRNRCFAVSIRKDIDTGWFEFPKPFDLGIRLKDVLEDDQEVIAKYFLSDEIQARLQITNKNFDTNVIGTTKPDFRTIGATDVVYNKDGIIGTLLARDYKQPKQIFVGENKPIQSATMMGKYEKMMDVSRRVYDENGIAPTIHTCGGGNTETKISRNNLKVVRKLTPKEVFRLQSFDDIDYDRCKALGMSDSQAYKATGNSICVKCLELVFQHLFKAQYDSDYKCFDEEVLEYQNEMEHAPSYLNTVGNVSTNNSQCGQVYDINGTAPTICAGTHGYCFGYVQDDRDIFIAASRGRMNENGVYDQHLEIRSNEYSNTLTTVPTDNLVVEVDSGNFMNPPA